MNAPSVDEYIDRLNDIPRVAISKLHQIRNIDKQVLLLHLKISQRREQALQKIFQYEAKPNPKLKLQINGMLRQVSNIHQSMINLASKKIKLSDQIYDCVDRPTEQLNRDHSIRIKQQDPSQQTKASKYKRPNKHHEQQFFASQPSYCYCKRPSFGLMVQCQNQVCDVEWFHRECVNEKNLGDKWYCLQCRKHRKTPGIKTRI